MSTSDLIKKEFYRNVADYMLPKPRKRTKVSVIVNNGEWLPIKSVIIGLWE